MDLPFISPKAKDVAGAMNDNPATKTHQQKTRRIASLHPSRIGSSTEDGHDGFRVHIVSRSLGINDQMKTPRARARGVDELTESILTKKSDRLPAIFHIKPEITDDRRQYKPIEKGKS